MPAETIAPTIPKLSTLLDLVQSLVDEIPSEDELVAHTAGLVNRGEVVLTGNFRGCGIEF